MCGILGVAVGIGIGGTRAGGARPSVGVERVERMRDRLAHRGPDDAGIYDAGNVILAHRRLSIIDLSAAGHQPMLSPCGRYAISYNGELYNDAEIRRELEVVGVRFRTSCDTETVLLALATWGLPAIDRFRGMFALAFLDQHRRRLTLSRDSLGIKPLFYWLGQIAGCEELVFASEVAAILAHPHVSARPDLAAVSGYLTTIRVTTGERTMWEGVRTLRTGEVRTFDLGTPDGSLRSTLATIRYSDPALERCLEHAREYPAASARDAVIESVHRHLRSDAGLGLMLSGGLDSSIIGAVAARRLQGGPAIRSYAAVQGDPTLPESEDGAFAAQMARAIDSDHTEVRVSREQFLGDWPAAVWAARVPLSTPNEIAIAQVAARMRDDGLRVALSGEGADELFAGYEPPLLAAAAFERTNPTRDQRIAFTLDSMAWVSSHGKGGVLNPDVWRRLEHDAPLRAAADEELRAAEREVCDDEPLQLHLAVQRRVNLHGLLMRLDACTMRQGIEGRTPLADVAVSRLALSLTLTCKFDPTRRPPLPPTARPSDGHVPITKLVLREAFGDEVPEAIRVRAKASFPLPFREWMAPSAGVVRTSALVRELFTEAAIEAVAAHPGQVWPLAWPMVNLALWDGK